MPTVSQEIKEAIQKGFTDASMTVSKHTADVIGDELGGALDDAKRLTGAALAPIAGAIGALGKDKESKSDKTRNNLLQEMVDYFNAEEIRKNKEFDPKEKKSPWYKLLVAVGLIVGGIAGAILLPFTLLKRALMGITPIAKFFGKFGKAVKGMKLFQYADDAVKWVAKLPILGTFFSAFKTGFKFLAWPIQAVFSLIDFIQGFMGTEGTLIDKIKGGLWGVIEGFIELPVKLFGWIADWFLGLFDIKVQGGTAAAIMGTVKDLAMQFFDVIFEFGSAVAKLFSVIYDLVQPYIQKFTSEFVEKWPAIVAQIKEVWESIKAFLKPKIEWVLSIFEELKPNLSTFLYILLSPITGLTNIVKFVTNFLSDNKFREDSIEKVKNVFDNLLTGIIQWITDIIPDIPILRDVKSKLQEKFLNKPEQLPTEVLGQVDKEKRNLVLAAARKKVSEEERKNKQIEKMISNQEKTAEAQAGATAAIVNSQKDKSVDKTEIPDKSENGLLGFAMAWGD
jgi:hypothetical protein